MSGPGNDKHSGLLRDYFNWYSRHFFPFYLSEHQNPKGRALHYSAAASGIAGAAASVATGSVLFLAAGIGASYLQAWAGHEKFERNMPATFTVPLGSLISDYVMAALWVTGRLDCTMRRHGLDPTGQNPVLRELVTFRDYRAAKADPGHEVTPIKAKRGETLLGTIKRKFMP